jgi:dihydroxy-acid dehydratase
LDIAAGKTVAENLESVPDLKEGQQVIMPLEQPIKATGHLQASPPHP